MNQGARADSVDVIPIPQQVHVGNGVFTFKSTTQILVEPSRPIAAEAGKYLADRLSTATGYPFKVIDAGAPGSGNVLLTTEGADASLGEEGYSLSIHQDGVVIRATHAQGLFYGVQTLLQLMPAAVYNSTSNPTMNWTVASVDIVDQPRFHWRGLMLDVSRHFEPVPVVMRLLDQMAMHKLNVFHWHLTDDQGWRIEIKKYPKLTSIGAWRDRPGFNMASSLCTTFGPDGRYGGFYTQDDVRQVVAYATARHIMVVPEIEMPGHATAALAAYPEMALAGRPFIVEDRGGIFFGVYDPANEQTFSFMQDVLTEVMGLFPSPYIHVGGDEVPKSPWENEPRDVALMQQEHLSGAEQLQSYFIGRIGKFLTAHGKHLIGWDEILEGGLVPDSTVMSWRGTKGGLAAAMAGHDVVMSPTSNCYFDGEQGRDTEPHERGALVTLENTYSYEPVPAGLSADKTSHILGVQGNLWTEYVPNGPWVEYMMWPRAAALSEVAWSNPASRSWEGFAKRVVSDERRLDAISANYRPIITDNLTDAIHLNVDEKVVIENPIPSSIVHYTTDDSYPTQASPTYSTPFDLPLGWVHLRARYYRQGIIATPASAAEFLDGHAVDCTSTMQNAWDTRRKCFFTPQWGMGENETITIKFKAGAFSIKQIIVQTGDGNIGSQLKHAFLESTSDNKAFENSVPFDSTGAAHLNTSEKPITGFRIRIDQNQVPKPVIRAVQLEN